MIDRKGILKKYNPKLTSINFNSPLTIGNSSIGMTIDPTGLQTLNDEYSEFGVPLCILSNWAWNSNKNYSLNDITLKHYQTSISKHNVKYPTICKKNERNLYYGLRENPHRANLLSVGFKNLGEKIKSKDITDINQTLDLYSGIVTSKFKFHGKNVIVKTFVGLHDSIGIEVCGGRSLQIEFYFSNSSPAINARCKDSNNNYTTLINCKNNTVTVHQILRNLEYKVNICFKNMNLEKSGEHGFVLKPLSDKYISLLINFKQDTGLRTINSIKQESSLNWNKFWNSVGFIQIQPKELQRRILLSQYLLHAQCSGKIPPQETGLTVNSWSGKFHLEMTPWHEAWLAIYNQTTDLYKLIKWYHSALPSAKQNAKINHYCGARWQKQIAPNLVESPSFISPLIIWQQPHIILLLELVYNVNKSNDFLNENWILIKETADFMKSFLVKKNNKYHIEGPVAASQEIFDPMKVSDPTFEIEYWRYGFCIANKWAKRCKKTINWKEFESNMTLVDESQNTYVPIRGISEKDTFSKFNRDHPTFVGIYGLIPTRMNNSKVKKTLIEVLKNWDTSSFWGWDYPMLAMVSSQLGNFQDAINILLSEDPKNTYLVNGNNYQNHNLPTYLPGNGSLLLAIAKIAKDFPNKIKTENLNLI